MFKQYECQHMSPFRDRVKLQRININYHFLLQFKLKPDTMKNLFYLPALAGLLMLAPRAQAQIINTVAGNGTEGYSGDNGPATSATLDRPWHTALDTSGNLYIADAQNNCVRKMNTAGVITTFAGNNIQGYSGDNGPATAAELYYPDAIATDHMGNVFIADVYNNCVRKVDAAGIITTYAGTTIQGYNGDSIAASTAKLCWPFGVATDNAGNLYIADACNNRIRKVNTAGIITTIAGDGTMGFGGDGGPATAAQFHVVQGVAIDNSNNVYISDEDNYRIRKVGIDGIINTIAGNGTEGSLGDGGPATAAELPLLPSVGVAGDGTVYIPCYGGQNVRKVGADGIITTIAGTGIGGYGGDTGPATDANLYYPAGVTVAPDGSFYIADAFNNVIRHVTPGPTGVQEVSSVQTIDIYPNPAHDITEVTLGNIPGRATLIVSDVLGRTVYSSDIAAGTAKTQVDLTGTAAGTYFLKLQYAGRYQTRKIVVE